MDWTDSPDPHRPSRKVVALLGSLFAVIAVAATLAFIPLPYAVMSPGPVTNTLGVLGSTKIIDIPADQSFPTSGKLFFTTVRVHGGPGNPVTIYDVLSAWGDADSVIRPEEELFPAGTTQEQVQQENVAEMEDSQKVAAAVAERATGKDVPLTVTVADVVSGSAADGLLQKGDVLVSIAGASAGSPAAVREAVRSKKPGDSIPIVVRRDGVDVSVAPVARDKDGVAVIGVAMKGSYQLPVDVKFNAGNVGGPSAGMMFTLAIYDLLTPGELTAGRTVAGTGTISDDGTVGPIGGIAQKLAGARAGGATVFLAPAANCAEVVGKVPAGLQVVRVSTFDEARAAMTALSEGRGDQLPSCAP